jgi:hypothetical protein
MQFNCDLEEKGENTHAASKQRSEFQITLNQGLPKVGVMSMLVHGLIIGIAANQPSNTKLVIVIIIKVLLWYQQ